MGLQGLGVYVLTAQDLTRFLRRTTMIQYFKPCAKGVGRSTNEEIVDAVVTLMRLPDEILEPNSTGTI